MNSSLRFGTALTALAMAGLVAGCATGKSRVAKATSPSATSTKVGLAMRAQLAVESGNFAAAVPLAEQAVQMSPDQAAFRAVLGNAYFGAGRFASAEAAYRDSLSLQPGQPKVVLKLALAAIAQGRNGNALAALESARDYLEAADYGLAIALAGQPVDAVAVLNQAARLPGADARTRQNLALAYALSGDWTMARTIAAQDVSPEQLDSHIQQWMAMATPVRPSDQVAALTGIKPAFDPGQPVHLALNNSPSAPRMAATAPQLQPVAVTAAPVMAQPAPTPAYLVPLPQPLAATPALPIAAEPEAPRIAEAVQAAAPVAEPEAAVAQILMEPAAEPDTPVEALPARFDAKPTVAKLVAAARKPVRARGRSNSVVQLGAYSSPEGVSLAWDRIIKRYPALAEYTPMRARFDGPKGTVWRLSIKGFASQQEAVARCERLQSRGGKCFVRRVAGDAPVQLASR